MTGGKYFVSVWKMSISGIRFIVCKFGVNVLTLSTLGSFSCFCLVLSADLFQNQLF